MTRSFGARAWFRRAALAGLCLLLAGGAWFFVYGGRFLQHEDPLSHADAIFVLAGSRADRWFEAVDLYRAGYAPVILLSPGHVEVTEQWLRAHGIRFPTDAELAHDAMVQLGIPPNAVLTPFTNIDNTAGEAEMLRRTAQRHGWTRVIVVTSKYHTRRAGFAMRRALKGSGITIIMHATRYDTSDPARWWHHRPDVRWVTLEWQKLLAYWCGLGE